MKEMYSVEIDRYDALALGFTIKKLFDNIPDSEYEWKLSVNAGGIDYGVFLNINVVRKEIEISNQPEFGSDGDDMLEDVIDYFNEDDPEEDE